MSRRTSWTCCLILLYCRTALAGMPIVYTKMPAYKPAIAIIINENKSVYTERYSDTSTTTLGSVQPLIERDFMDSGYHVVPVFIDVADRPISLAQALNASQSSGADFLVWGTANVESNLGHAGESRMLGQTTDSQWADDAFAQSQIVGGTRSVISAAVQTQVVLVNGNKMEASASGRFSAKDSDTIHVLETATQRMLRELLPEMDEICDRFMQNYKAGAIQID
ncbi:MAG: hypothetical protein EOL87_09575 [Spartobacteria bacterium]|nr:hypothetical protein [Spartobacteria bacterium]